VSVNDLSFAEFDGTNNISGNLGQPDVACYPQYSATRGAGTVGARPTAWSQDTRDNFEIRAGESKNERKKDPRPVLSGDSFSWEPHHVRASILAAGKHPFRGLGLRVETHSSVRAANYVKLLGLG